MSVQALSEATLARQLLFAPSLGSITHVIVLDTVTWVMEVTSGFSGLERHSGLLAQSSTSARLEAQRSYQAMLPFSGTIKGS
jgi:hypothetical protein